MAFIIYSFVSFTFSKSTFLKKRSTLLLLYLPSGVAFVSIGNSSPYHNTLSIVILSDSPLSLKSFARFLALSSESLRLYFSLPVESVCPTSSMLPPSANLFIVSVIFLIDVISSSFRAFEVPANPYPSLPTTYKGLLPSSFLSTLYFPIPYTFVVL